jgi:DNA-directed RNA polymerase II subunit RPB2
MQPLINPDNIKKISDKQLELIIHSEIKEKGLVGHHIDSFNEFARVGIKQIVEDIFSVNLSIINTRDHSDYDKKIKNITCKINFKNVKIGQPTYTDFDTEKQRLLTPSYARINNLTYSAPLYLDVFIEAKAFLYDKDEPIVRNQEIKEFKIAYLPIMIRSKLCNTYVYKDDFISMKDNQEDPFDEGGYFIVDGNEWSIDNMETRLFNYLHAFKNIGYKKEIARGEFLSRAGDAFENSHQIKIYYLKDGQITFDLTYNYFSENKIPFYVIFRLLGMTRDKDIIDNIVYGYGSIISDHMVRILKNCILTPNKEFPTLHKLRNPSQIVDELSDILANNYSSNMSGTTEDKAKIHERTYLYLKSKMMDIFDITFLSHIGQDKSLRERKLRFFGYMIHKLLLVEFDIVPSTDRDSLKGKRIKSAGLSYAAVFKTQFNLTVVQSIKNKLKKEFIQQPFNKVNLEQSFKSSISGHELDRGLVQAITTDDNQMSTGNKVVQNRLASQQLHRKNKTKTIASARVVRTKSTSSSSADKRAMEMREVHETYPGFIDVVDSAHSGKPVGLIKQMSMGASICLSSSSNFLKMLLLEESVTPLYKIFPEDIYIKKLSRVFVNGDWIGCVEKGYQLAKKYRQLRRKTMINNETGINKLTTIYFDVETSDVFFWVDFGRIMRPLLIVANNIEYPGFFKEKYNPVENTGFAQSLFITPDMISNLLQKKITIKYLVENGYIDYISAEEQENCLIAESINVLIKNINNPLLQYTHCEIPISLLGLVSLTAPYCDHNQIVRIVYQVSQANQTCGWFALNWPFRIDKNQFYQYDCDKPLISTFSNKYIYPNGMNVVLALLSYGGFNQEDSIIMNQASIDRGLFKGTQFSFITSILEEDEEFEPFDALSTKNIKRRANYGKLVGKCVQVGTMISKGDIIISKVLRLKNPVMVNNQQYTKEDKSVVYPGPEDAIVNHVIVSRNQKGQKFITVQYRSIREPSVGDKFCLTDDYEVLTLTGWKSIDKIGKTDFIATLNNDFDIKYHTPYEIIKIYHNERIYKINNDYIELDITPAHRMFVSDNSYNYNLLTAEEIAYKDYYFLTGTKPINFTSRLVKDKHWSHYDDYYGYVYCLSIQNGVFCVKRKETNKIVWTGNSSRVGQKGVVSMIYKQSDMPFTESGIIPDIIMNPHSIPSRMTFGQLIEMAEGKISAHKGQIRDGTIFRKTDIELIRDELSELGFNRYGNERMYSGMTGEMMTAEIFIGPVYEQRLQKFVVDEKYVINQGQRELVTRQYMDGKVNRGGLRISELLKDGLLIHGSIRFLMEKFTNDCDLFHMYVCRICGKRAIVNEINNIYICQICKDFADIVKIKTRWSSNLFLHELEGMDVGIRLGIKNSSYDIEL